MQLTLLAYYMLRNQPPKWTRKQANDSGGHTYLSKAIRKVQ